MRRSTEYRKHQDTVHNARKREIIASLGYDPDEIHRIPKRPKREDQPRRMSRRELLAEALEELEDYHAIQREIASLETEDETAALESDAALDLPVLQRAV